MIKTLRSVVSQAIFVLEAVLVVRIVSKLMGLEGGFFDGLYAGTQPIVQPFTVFFPAPAVRGTMIIEFATLAAVFAFAIGGYVIQQVLRVFPAPAPTSKVGRASSTPSRSSTSEAASTQEE